MNQTEQDIIAGLQEALDLSPFMKELMDCVAKHGVSYARITIEDGIPKYEGLNNILITEISK